MGKNRILSLIQNNDIDKAMKLMIQKVKLNKTDKEIVIGQSSRYKDVCNHFDQGRITYEQYSVVHNNVVVTLTGILNKY